MLYEWLLPLDFVQLLPNIGYEGLDEFLGILLLVAVEESIVLVLDDSILRYLRIWWMHFIASIGSFLFKKLNVLFKKILTLYLSRSSGLS